MESGLTFHMSFFKPLRKTAPEFDPRLPWPLDGTAYVAMFMGPISAGFMGGLFAPHLGSLPIGLVVGLGLAFLNAWLNDLFIDSWVARHQRFLRPIPFRILINLIAFVWSLVLSGAAMLAPFAVFGSPLPPYLL
jgi:hypothetical protein